MAGAKPQQPGVDLREHSDFRDHAPPHDCDCGTRQHGFWAGRGRGCKIPYAISSLFTVAGAAVSRR